MVVQNPDASNHTLGEQVLLSRGIYPHNYYYWVGVGALLLTIIIFNVLYTITLTYLSRKSSLHPMSNLLRELNSGYYVKRNEYVN
jgi:hypothetical protein